MDYSDIATVVRKMGGAGGAPSGRLFLLCITEGAVQRHPLPDSGEVTIGRSDKNDIHIEDPSISRKHALLRLGDSMTIEDLGSANGSRVRGTPLAAGKPVEVAIDETIELGSTTVIIQRRASPTRLRRLWTHDYFEGRLADECARAERSGSKFALVRFHCDRGAPGELVQEALADGLRAIDVFGLYAPGEYEALLIDATPEEALMATQRITERLGQRQIKVQTGIACYPRDGRDPDSLVAKACAMTTPQAAASVPDSIVVTDRTMEQLYQVVQRIAAGNLSVLILGETGVGKEVLAEAVHRMSPRAAKPFLRLNCAALSESLLESELFGHEKGAFTGAVAQKPGLLETAQGGTVFLDEVGELPVATQVKLLRVIEERQVLRVGSLKPRPIDVRFVAATNRDLEAEIARAAFRQDLFFRLNGFTLVVPPLRERVSEIEGLARAFIAHAAKQNNMASLPRLSAEALEVLRAYSWPGNIRELRNVIERAVLLSSGGTIALDHLPVEKMKATLALKPAEPPTPPPAPPVADDHGFDADEPTPVGMETPPVDLKSEVAAAERRKILEALNRCAGNQTQAARLLGISRRTLINRLDEYGITRPRKGR